MDSGEDLYAPPENHSTEQPFAASGQSIRSNSADVVNEALPLSALRSSSDSSFHGINEKVCDQPLAALEQSMRPADTVAIPIEETPSTSAAEFNKLADEVRAATDSAEKVLEDYTAEADQLQKAKEKLESQEPTLSKLSDMATAMAQSGDTDGIDVVSSLAQQFEGVRCAIEDRIDDVAHEEEEEAPTTSDAEFNRLVDEVRAATDAAENVLLEGTSDVDRLQKTREALESHEPAWTKLTDLAMVRVHSGDTDGYDVVSSLSEQYEAVRFAIVDRIDELRSEEHTENFDTVANANAPVSLSVAETPVVDEEQQNMCYGDRREEELRRMIEEREKARAELEYAQLMLGNLRLQMEGAENQNKEEEHSTSLEDGNEYLVTTAACSSPERHTSIVGLTERPYSSSRVTPLSNTADIPKEAEIESVNKSLSCASLHFSIDSASRQPPVAACASGDDPRYRPVRVVDYDFDVGARGDDSLEEHFYDDENVDVENQGEEMLESSAAPRLSIGTEMSDVREESQSIAEDLKGQIRLLKDAFIRLQSENRALKRAVAGKADKKLCEKITADIEVAKSDLNVLFERTHTMETKVDGLAEAGKKPKKSQRGRGKRGEK